MLRQEESKQREDGAVWSFNLPKALDATDEYAPLSPEDEATATQTHKRLIQEVDLKAVEKLGVDRGREAVEAAARQLVMESAPGLYGERKEMVIKRVVDDAIGLGPLEPLISDTSISEVMVNAPDEVYFERDGIIYLSALRFRDKDHIMLVVDRIIARWAGAWTRPSRSSTPGSATAPVSMSSSRR